MNERDIKKQMLAGSFFVIGILIIVLFVIAIGQDKGLTKAKFQITVLFKDVGGLMEGAPVRLAGVGVGTVATIDFLEKEIEGRRVKVILNIFKKYKKQIQKSTNFAIKTEGILGEKLIEIDADIDKPAIDLTKSIIGQDPLDVQDVAEAFGQAAEAFTKTSQDISNIDMDELSKLMGDTARSLSSTSEGMNAVLKELQYLSVKTKRLLDRIEQRVIDGNLFRVF